MQTGRSRWYSMLAALCVGLAIAVGTSGCAGVTGVQHTTSGQTQEVDVDDYKVTERDLEVARQMQAPEQVIESMEAGEWRYVSDREAVRYAELAIDHMQEAHGQECEARWSTVPWVLADEARVTLAVVGGAHDGAEVTVHVSVDDNHACADNWYAVVHHAEYEAAMLTVLEEALSDVPHDAWVASAALQDASLPVGIADDLPLDKALTQGSANVDLFLAASAVADEEALEALRVEVLHAFIDRGYDVYVWLCVVPDTPDGEPLTEAYGRERVRQAEDLMSTSGIYAKE